MKIFRLVLLFLVCIVALSWLAHTKAPKNAVTLPHPKKQTHLSVPAVNMEKLELKAGAARLFVQQKGYNDNTCFLLDMSLPSGQNRFFIYDLKKSILLASALVAHGNCFEYWLEGRKYSNVVGSGCTSLGKYRIGNPYTGKFGYSYKLYGLDSTNNNAFERTVVLHGHDCVPEAVTTDEICQSNGCPMVSPNLLIQLKSIIGNSKKPILLWIYN